MKNKSKPIPTKGIKLKLFGVKGGIGPKGQTLAQKMPSIVKAKS